MLWKGDLEPAVYAALVTEFCKEEWSFLLKGAIPATNGKGLLTFAIVQYDIYQCYIAKCPCDFIQEYHFYL